MLHEVPVDIFQRSAGSLWVKQVDERHESAVEHGPDDVELPVERVYADWGDFDHDEVAYCDVVRFADLCTEGTLRTLTQPIGGSTQSGTFVLH